MTTPTPSPEVKALSVLVNIIMDAVRDSPNGMPEGHLYAALMSIPNFRLEHLQLILGTLESQGKITRSNFLVKAVR